MAQIIKFACLTGLRPSESCEAVRLLNSSSRQGATSERRNPQYYNPETQTLEHFRFPDIFLRTTKKAFISFITPDNLQPITSLDCKTTPTWNAIRLTCRRRGINMNMKYCRRLFASHLHRLGISDLVIDLLQGRTPSSVLHQHYIVLKPSFKADVLQAVEKLKREIDS